MAFVGRLTSFVEDDYCKKLKLKCDNVFLVIQYLLDVTDCQTCFYPLLIAVANIQAWVNSLECNIDWWRRTSCEPGNSHCDDLCSCYNRLLQHQKQLRDYAQALNEQFELLHSKIDEHSQNHLQ